MSYCVHITRPLVELVMTLKLFVFTAWNTTAFQVLFDRLTLSPLIPLRLYTLPYWSNPPFLIFDIQALWRSRLERQSAWMSKIKNGGLDQYGAGPLEQQQFGTAGIEGVNRQVNPP